MGRVYKPFRGRDRAVDVDTIKRRGVIFGLVAVRAKIQSVDMRMRIGMRRLLSPNADVPWHTSGAAMCHEELWAEIWLSSHELTGWSC